MDNNRKSFLINPPFQLSIVGWFLALAVVLILVFYLANWYFFYNFSEQARSMGIEDGHVFFLFLKEQQLFMNKIFIFAGIVATLILSIGGIYLSHKVAGPLYRLTKHLEQNSLKDAKSVTFRKGDYFMEVKDAFNEFIKRN